MAEFTVALVAFDDQPVPDWVSTALANEGVRFIARECKTAEELAQHAGDADVVWVFGGSRVVTAESLALLPRCGAIIRTGSGTDNVPVEEATRLGILVAHTPEAHSDAVSDHVIGLLFTIVRQIAVQDRNVRAGVWNASLAQPRWHVRGQTLGLVGFGHIARLVARKMSGFQMTILAHDPFVSPDTVAGAGGRAASLDEVLAQSDFVSLHCPLTKETYHLIGERELRLMKPEAILINTSRGPVVDEPALVRALSEGWIAGAGLDVLEQEPAEPENPLLKMDHVVITPHIGGYSDEHLEACWRLSFDTVMALARGRWPRAYVNRGVTPRWQLA